MWTKRKRIDVHATAANGIVLTTKELHSLSGAERNDLRYERNVEYRRRRADEKSQGTQEFEAFERGTSEARMRESYYEMQLAQSAVDHPPYGGEALKGALMILLAYWAVGVWFEIVTAFVAMFYAMHRLNDARLVAREDLKHATEKYEFNLAEYEKTERRLHRS